MHSRLQQVYMLDDGVEQPMAVHTSLPPMKQALARRKIIS